MEQFNRRTIGFLSTWSVFEGTAIDRYTRALLAGVQSATREHDCNLLISCGISLPDSPRGSRTAWPVPGQHADFLPVGPWNTDGLILIPDDLTTEQDAYIQDLIRSGFPVIFTTAEKPGPVVKVDNHGGIGQAFGHLYEHGHRQIAFIAGKSERGGDTQERLSAFRELLQQSGLTDDPRLVAFGEHRQADGRSAMRTILQSGAPFSAVIASNDLSAIGAIEELRAAGREVPDDVAVVGFDDIIDSRSHHPPLTTVRHPMYALGYNAVTSLLEFITTDLDPAYQQTLSTQLIVRQSCGCHSQHRPRPPALESGEAAVEPTLMGLESALVDCIATEARYMLQQDIAPICRDLIDGFLSSIAANRLDPFHAVMLHAIQITEQHQDDIAIWDSALYLLEDSLISVQARCPGANKLFIGFLLEHARTIISENARRQATDTLLWHMELSNRLGLMTAQLLNTSDIHLTEQREVLTAHLQRIGLEHILVALYAPGEDPKASAEIIIDAGPTPPQTGRLFQARAFPPPGLFASDQPYQLALLPMNIDEQCRGLAAIRTTNLDPCAAITHHLISAIRTSRLYQSALRGQQQAEEANRMKSRFLSTVSHELRTPISMIVGLSELVIREQRHRPELSERAHRDLEQIYLSSQHLARMLGDVLDLTSPEIHQLQFDLAPLDLAEVLRVASAVGEQLAKEKGLTWTAEFEPRGPWVRGSTTRLRQVVLNLISNAVKFTPAGMVRLEVALQPHEVTVAVSDSGIGIPPAERGKLFSEFSRTEQSIAYGFGGLGLGLAISKQIIEKHGGTIGFNSPGEAGAGSTFFFRLPRLADEEVVEPAANLPEQNSNLVFVLTGSGASPERLTRHLLERGFEVHTELVNREPDWFSRLQERLPGVVLVDDQLSKRERMNLLTTVKQDPRTVHIPVLVYSLDWENQPQNPLARKYLPLPLTIEPYGADLGALEQASSTSNGQPVVLIVEDDPGVIDIHSRIVEMAGFRPVRARNGREALTVIEHFRPDLILLDLVMPVMDGFETLDALAQRESTRNIPVIVLTGRALTAAEMEGFHRGVFAVLSKGLFDSGEIVAHIEQALTNQGKLGSLTQRLARQAMAYIHLHYAEPVDRESIAAQVGVSADYLAECFRKEFGITPIKYLNRYRVRQACLLLEQTDRSIKEIALMAGFFESTHFSRIFQREMGTTPRAYRKGRRDASHQPVHTRPGS